MFVIRNHLMPPEGWSDKFRHTAQFGASYPLALKNSMLLLPQERSSMPLQHDGPLLGDHSNRVQLLPVFMSGSIISAVITCASSVDTVQGLLPKGEA